MGLVCYLLARAKYMVTQQYFPSQKIILVMSQQLVSGVHMKKESGFLKCLLRSTSKNTASMPKLCVFLIPTARIWQILIRELFQNFSNYSSLISHLLSWGRGIRRGRFVLSMTLLRDYCSFKEKDIQEIFTI